MAAKAFGYDYFFRICGDRPVFEMEEIRSWAYQIKNGDFLNVDLITNYNPGLIKGITTELISVRALSQIATLDLLSDAQREHVTSYFYDNPSKFNIFYRPSKFINLRNGNLAVDTIDDFTSLSSFFDLKSDLDVSTEEVVEFLGLENCYE
jgi:spore coat polysaccharide biosynthesis protein SpsF (cytidylyltransferase family)